MKKIITIISVLIALALAIPYVVAFTDLIWWFTTDHALIGVWTEVKAMSLIPYTVFYCFICAGLATLVTNLRD